MEVTSDVLIRRMIPRSPKRYSIEMAFIVDRFCFVGLILVYVS